MTELHRVRVDPGRLERWLAGFALRHPEPTVTLSADSVELASPDGARAWVRSPWGAPPPGELLAGLVAQATRPRRIGALLVRRNSHAVGIFDGDELVRHRVGRHYVQGKTKAGGWSQQRYARRRGNQATRAFDRAAADAAEILVPVADTLDAVLLGGDTQAVRTVLADPALADLQPVLNRHPLQLLPVADPNLQVLRDALPRVLSVTIELNPEARGAGWARADQ